MKSFKLTLAIADFFLLILVFFAQRDTEFIHKAKTFCSLATCAASLIEEVRQQVEQVGQEEKKKIPKE
ncbi:MAG: hypothetical protein KME64_33505 [Scytonematopsis contorta HA4267-MV1]|jgi:hypothetical protein|nr:hypothetical protein [Scytonematopsis contorta HA4267-MV1]